MNPNDSTITSRPGTHRWALGFRGFTTVFVACIPLLFAQAADSATNSPEADPPSNSDVDSASGASSKVRLYPVGGIYQDHPGEPGTFALLSGDLQRPNSFFALISSLEQLAEDDSMDGVLFDFSNPVLGMNLAQVTEFSRAVERLNTAGKTTVAWIENGSFMHYMAALSCDEIVMADMGLLDFPSPSLTTLHFYDAMNMLGIRAQVVRTGDFKGAAEPFTRSSMTDKLRAHYRELLASINEHLVERIASVRGVSVEAVRGWQRLRLFTPVLALEKGLVDRVAAYGTQRASAADFFQSPVQWVEPPKKQRRQLSFFELMSKLMGGGASSQKSGPALAVLHLDGQILDGEEEQPGLMISGPTVKAIRELTESSQVQGVLVRINSPGGSATGSEAIRQALQKLAENKPVVISMGSLAASGGYWITGIGAPIYAEPSTLTGSIGVFAMKLSLGPLLQNAGLNLQSVTLDDSATAMSPDRLWFPEEEEQIRHLISDIYEQFLLIVSESRNLPQEKVRTLAEGRVWSGAQAKELGLVDDLGGIKEALLALEEETAIEPGYEVLHRPRQKTLFEMLEALDPGAQASASWPAMLSRTGLRALNELGFHVEPFLHMVQREWSSSVPTTWLMLPTVFRLR